MPACAFMAYQITPNMSVYGFNGKPIGNPHLYHVGFPVDVPLNQTNPLNHIFFIDSPIATSSTQAEIVLRPGARQIYFKS
jgi:hypothetical protein